MTKRTIWWIVGAMAAALLGIIFLQIYSIRKGIQLNEDQLDKNVAAVLGGVSEQLSDMEREEGLNAISGFSVRELEKDTFFRQNEKTNLQLNNITNLEEFNAQVRSMPLADRINAHKLDEIIRKEMANRRLFTEYNYGVFSNKINQFVIYNGHYLIRDMGPSPSQNRFQNLKNSNYHATLFLSDDKAPGEIMLEFPQKRKFIWSILLPFAIAAAMFTAIILVSFSYTIFIVFRQKKISEMKTDFMNNMTHEFKTPIATISLAADSITNPAIIENPDKIKRFAHIISQENKRMHTQVEQVLRTARMEKKDFQLDIQPVDIHQLITGAVENINLQVAQKEGIMNTKFLAKTSLIRLDKTHISNIIYNLLDNANKYSPEKPEILVQTNNVKGGIEVLIQDKGLGMSREAKKHIFDKFYRVHTGNRHDVKGFGLGLSYVKTIVDLHRGDISVTSELGKGSTFRVFLPNNL